MKYHLIYVHGWGSSQQTSSMWKHIESEFGQRKDIDLTYFKYDELQPRKTFNKLEMLVQKIVKSEYEPVIIAQSNGGFFGQLISQKYDIRTILINPSLTPGVSLMKHKSVTNKISQEYESFTIIPRENQMTKIVILSSDDEVIPPQLAYDTFNGKCKLLSLRGETHRLSQMGYKIVLSSIHTILNTITS